MRVEWKNLIGENEVVEVSDLGGVNRKWEGEIGKDLTWVMMDLGKERLRLRMI